MTHICVSKLTIIGSHNGLSPGQHQAIICTNAGILLIWTLWTNISEILSETHTFSFKKMHMKMSSGRLQSFCLGLNVLIGHFGTNLSEIFMTVYILPFMKMHLQMLSGNWQPFSLSLSVLLNEAAVPPGTILQIIVFLQFWYSALWYYWMIISTAYCKAEGTLNLNISTWNLLTW